MTKIPLVVRTDFKLATNNPDKKNKNANKDLDYIKRTLEYFSDEKKKVFNLVDYFTGKINKNENINLVLENGNYATEEEKEKRKNYMLKQFMRPPIRMP